MLTYTIRPRPPLWSHPSHPWLTFSTPAILTSLFFLKDVKNMASQVLWSSCFFCLEFSSLTCLPDPQIHFVDECFHSISAKTEFPHGYIPKYREALANAIHLKSKKQTNDNNNRNWRDQEEKNPYLVTTECIIDDYIPEKNALSHLIPKQHWKLSNIISFYGE